MWRNTTLVHLKWMPFGIAILENSMECPQKSVSRISIWFRNFTLVTHAKELKLVYQNSIWTSIFITASITTARTWKQLKCLATDKWVKINVAYMHKEIICCLKKYRNLVIWDNVDKLGRHYTKWNKPSTEKQVLYDLTLVWTLTKFIT
jgi:hypothetical protein